MPCGRWSPACVSPRRSGMAKRLIGLNPRVPSRTRGHYNLRLAVGRTARFCQPPLNETLLMNGEARTSEPHHRPVLPSEVLNALVPAPGQTIVDATIGAGGHAQLLVKQLGPDGRLIGLDRDPTMLDLARPRLEGYPVTLVHANF